MAEKVELIIEVKGGDSVGKASEKVTSLKTQLKQLKEQLASGTLAPDEFEKVAKKAGELSDRIGDVNQKVKTLGSDTKRLDGFIGIATGITSGFAAAQGAMALFGSENEDLQKTLIKVQGATALLNGLQGIQLALQKESAAMTAIQSARLQVLTFLQTRYTAAVGGTTGAMRLLRIAGAALGIGLIIGAIALLVSNFDKLKNTIGKFLPSLDSIVKGFKAAYNAVTDFLGVTSDQTRVYDRLKASTDQRSKDIKREIELLEAQGASERVIFQKRLTLIDNELAVLKAKRDSKQKLSQEEIENEKDLNNQRAIELAKYHKGIDEELSKNTKTKVKAVKVESEKIKEAQQDAHVEAHKLYVQQSEEDMASLMETLEQELEVEQSIADRRIELDKQIYENKVSIAKDGLSALSDLTTAFAGKSEEGQRRAFAINKALNISTTIIDTYMAAQKAYASQLSIPTPDAPIRAQIAAGIAVAGGLARVTAIGRTEFGSRGISNSSGGSLPSNNAPNIKGFQTGSTGRQNGQGGSMKVYVTETDIRKSTNKTNSIYYQATVD